MVAQLPPTSRLAVALRGGATHDGWDVGAYLLAAAVDAVNTSAYVTAQVNSRKRIPAPDPIPRPGDDPSSARRRVVTVAQLAAAHNRG